MNSNKAIQNLIEISKYKKPAIFCGAGISYNSGLPIVSALLNYLFDKLELTKYRAENIYSSNLPFEIIMEMVLGESGLDEIQEIFGGGNPNTNHFLIAKLAKWDYVNIIYTTNFDILIIFLNDPAGHSTHFYAGKPSLLRPFLSQMGHFRGL